MKRSATGSFINNKTQKAINGLTWVTNGVSIESTYGFRYIWKRIKSDLGLSSLTEEKQEKLRTIILGAFKNKWVVSKLKELGIDPISLFKNKDGNLSLANELNKIKVRSRFDAQLKKNELLNILYNANTNAEFDEHNTLVEILDFIKVHIPFTSDKNDANKYITAWKELYDNKRTSDFAVKLMFYSILTSNDAGGQNLFKYVPFEMLEDFGLFDFEREQIRNLGSIELLYKQELGSFEEDLAEQFGDIIKSIESILVEDYDFSTPINIEEWTDTTDPISGVSGKKLIPMYTGFGTAFGNTIVNDNRVEAANRIPFVMVPVKFSKSGRSYKTLTDKYGNIINRAYIRVRNPLATYDN
jgi:hypothetical protein